MNALLEQFLLEGRDCLQGIGEKLMQLESRSTDADLMTELFRLVHTLKGNSGLFEFPEMTRVLHAGEDLMDSIRDGRVGYSQQLADVLLDAMDFVGMLCDEIEATEALSPSHIATSAQLAKALRRLIAPEAAAQAGTASAAPPVAAAVATPLATPPFALASVPEAARMAAYRHRQAGGDVFALIYTPSEECFFQGDDPLHQAMQTPGLLWGGVKAQAAWPALAELDAYRCVLSFEMLSSASGEALAEYYRYMPDAVQMQAVAARALILPVGDPNGGPVYEDFVVDALSLLARRDSAGLQRAAETMLDLSSADLWLSSALRWLLLVIELAPHDGAAQRALIVALRDFQAPVWAAAQDEAQGAAPVAADDVEQTTRGNRDQLSSHLSPDEQQALASLVANQKRILSLPVADGWQLGRVRAAAGSLNSCIRMSGDQSALSALEDATEASLGKRSNEPLLSWIERYFGEPAPAQAAVSPLPAAASSAAPVATAAPDSGLLADPSVRPEIAAPENDVEIKFERRSENAPGVPRSLKVDQGKIDRLMNLIGEMVVSKNALPYLAGRAESVFGVRELAREIKAQYAVINRIAEEMQDAIMQVRMMPVSSVFQRFPRLVRDISRRLGKDVQLVLEGEDTEADKNIIESLGDPLMHIVRNSLDHGFELPAVRVEAGKTAQGTLTIRASQESDRVVIEISDDGKGIDPSEIKRKAYEKGVIDEVTLNRISDQDAINLVFAAGFSTAEVVSDLSGRGVGMDVVRSAIERVNGSIHLESAMGQGTRLRLSLPLSMAVTNVMIIESDKQIFGVPMDAVVETVRVRRADIHTIKQSLATVLRGRIVPLKSLNKLLGIAAPPLANEEDELAVLVVRLGDEVVGLLVDDFCETIDIILKPMTSVLAGLPAYSGSALMGDGSVLMVLNIKEVL